MGDLLVDLAPESDYVDRKALLASPSEEAYYAARDKQVAESRTVYVGNLGFYTSEAQLLHHFSGVGRVEDVIMGLNSISRQPAGFAFVVFEEQTAAAAAVACLHLSRVDDRVIRVSWDMGRVRDTGRFWGRGFTGGQIRDEYRHSLDKARGGFGVRRAVEAGVEQDVLDDEVVTYDWVAPPQQKRRNPKRER